MLSRPLCTTACGSFFQFRPPVPPFDRNTCMYVSSELSRDASLGFSSVRRCLFLGLSHR
jgi:hypothetical protein